MKMRKKQTQMAVHWDFSSIANCQTKMPTRDIWNCLWYVRIFIYLFHNFLWNSGWKTLI